MPDESIRHEMALLGARGWGCVCGVVLNPKSNGTDLRGKALPYKGFKAAKSLNHEGHKEHEGKARVFFVLFVVPVQISQPVSTPLVYRSFQLKSVPLTLREGLNCQ